MVWFVQFLMRYNVLTQMKARSAEAGKYADGQGLWLCKRNKQFGKWILRLVIGGKRREMGLGSWPDVSIAEARERAAAARRRVRDGVDPIAERQEERRIPEAITVAQAIESCFASKKAELKGDGITGKWLPPLSNHIIPKLGDEAIEKLDQHHIRDVLEPIWQDKPGVAVKALSRLNLSLKHSVALGLDVDLQAALIGGDIWTLPPERTKTGKEHRVPLGPEALKLVEEARSQSPNEYLCNSPGGKPLSNMAMAMLMRKNGYEARPHGLRSKPILHSRSKRQLWGMWSIAALSEPISARTGWTRDEY